MITSGVSPQVVSCVMSKSESRNRLIGIRMIVLGWDSGMKMYLSIGDGYREKMGNKKNGEYLKKNTSD